MISGLMFGQRNCNYQSKINGGGRAYIGNASSHTYRFVLNVFESVFQIAMTGGVYLQKGSQNQFGWIRFNCHGGYLFLVKRRERERENREEEDMGYFINDIITYV